MKGVRTGVIEIQKDFLDFELKYKSTQNVFDEVYKLTKIIKRAKMDEINEMTYTLADMFIGMSEKYLSTKIKIMEIENDYSLLDDYVKHVVLTMMEQNKTMLMDIELNLKVLLSSLVERKVVPKQKINKIIEKEEKSNGSVIFISKYETIDSYDNLEYICSIFLREHLRKIFLIIFLTAMLLFVPKVSDGLIDLFTAYNSTVLESALSDSTAITPSFPYHIFIDMMSTLLTSIIGVYLFLIINVSIFQLISDLLYIYIPLLRPYLRKMVSNNLGIEPDRIPVHIEKFKLVRAKEIISSIRGIPEYCNAPVVLYLDSRLKNKTVEEVLSMEDIYAIMLVEELYQVINNYHNTNKELVEYSLGLVLNNFERSHKLLKVLVLKERLGIN